MNFGEAFEAVKQGKGMRLPKWAPDVVIRAQYPDEHSKMTAPYARKKEHEQKKREAELKDQIMLLFNQALQIGNVVGRLMDNKVAIRLPKEYYPELFGNEEEKTNFTEQEDAGDKRKLSPEMELHKARMDDFIFRHNMAMRERLAKERGEENSGRNDTGTAASNH